MGATVLRRIELITTTSEVVGHKSGLALSRKELDPHIPDDLRAVWTGPDEEIVRVRSEEYEEIVYSVLHGIGNIANPSLIPSPLLIWKKYQSVPEKLAVVDDLISALPGFLAAAMKKAKDEGVKKLNPEPFWEMAREKHGQVGTEIAGEILLGLNADQHKSPWTDVRRLEWKDRKELKELFVSESLSTLYGEYFDQRFIDYLDKNFGDISRINWRKFEGLACEHFVREGCEVRIEKGRNDDSIDARVWKNGDHASGPPTVLVQCKREKKKVGKVVVKALWADVTHEGAQSGLIVTTNELSPGAVKTCTARGYKIDQANRSNLRDWISAMRTPLSGVFMGA